MRQLQRVAAPARAQVVDADAQRRADGRIEHVDVLTGAVERHDMVTWIDVKHVNDAGPEAHHQQLGPGPNERAREENSESKQTEIPTRPASLSITDARPGSRSDSANGTRLALRARPATPSRVKLTAAALTPMTRGSLRDRG